MEKRWHERYHESSHTSHTDRIILFRALKCDCTDLPCCDVRSRVAQCARSYRVELERFLPSFPHSFRPAPAAPTSSTFYRPNDITRRHHIKRSRTGLPDDSWTIGRLDALWTDQFVATDLKKNHVYSNFLIPILHQIFPWIDQTKTHSILGWYVDWEIVAYLCDKRAEEKKTKNSIVAKLSFYLGGLRQWLPRKKGRQPLYTCITGYKSI